MPDHRPPRYLLGRAGVSITCLSCGQTSFNPNDVQQRYCAHCHRFHDDEQWRSTIVIQKYDYRMDGTAADGQTWSTQGTVVCEFGDALFNATRDSFRLLTDGRAVYGKPGVGCVGPYNVTRLSIELRP